MCQVYRRLVPGNWVGRERVAQDIARSFAEGLVNHITEAVTFFKYRQGHP